MVSFNELIFSLSTTKWCWLVKDRAIVYWLVGWLVEYIEIKTWLNEIVKIWLNEVKKYLCRYRFSTCGSAVRNIWLSWVSPDFSRVVDMMRMMRMKIIHSDLVSGSGTCQVYTVAVAGSHHRVHIQCPDRLVPTLIYIIIYCTSDFFFPLSIFTSRECSIFSLIEHYTLNAPMRQCIVLGNCIFIYKAELTLNNETLKHNCLTVWEN